MGSNRGMYHCLNLSTLDGISDKACCCGFPSLSFHCNYFYVPGGCTSLRKAVRLVVDKFRKNMNLKSSEYVSSAEILPNFECVGVLAPCKVNSLQMSQADGVMSFLRSLCHVVVKLVIEIFLVFYNLVSRMEIDAFAEYSFPLFECSWLLAVKFLRLTRIGAQMSDVSQGLELKRYERTPCAAGENNRGAAFSFSFILLFLSG